MTTLITAAKETKHYYEVLFLYPINPSEINPGIGIGPTRGQRKTLTRVGFEPTTSEFDRRCSTD